MLTTTPCNLQKKYSDKVSNTRSEMAHIVVKCNEEDYASPETRPVSKRCRIWAKEK
jgi:hypothetical protein